MMADLWVYPPLPFLEQVLRHCPRSGLLYLKLWQEKNEECRCHFSKKDISNFMHPHAFSNALRKLCDEGLVSCNEGQNSLTIELVDWSSMGEND